MAENALMAQWGCDILDENLEMFGFDRNGMPLFQTLGFARGGETLCVVIVYQYSSPNIFMAFAATSPRWASKENVRALGVWVFDDLGCGRITTLTKKNNKRSRKFQEGVGFIHEGKLRRATDDGDVIIYGLTKEDHKAWLRKAFHGKEITSKSA